MPRTRPTVANLFTPPATHDDEVSEKLAGGAATRVERIVSPAGHRSPPDSWYDQEEEEWVAVLTGEGALEIEGEDELVVLRPGDHVTLPAGLRHRVAWTSHREPTVWLAVFYGGLLP